jgi:hypothetical protein
MLKKLGLLAQRWRRLWMFTPVFAVAAVALAVLAMDLTFGGADSGEPQNLAPPPSEIKASTPRVRTPILLMPTVTPTVMPTLTMEAGPVAHMRDNTRKSDLLEMKEALGQYRREEKEYPSTSGNVQTACNYTDIDALCALDDFLDPFPVDPLGDPGKNGYWYASDGKTYLLIAAMEAPENASPKDACPEAVKDFVGKGNLLCLPGP